jgi:hypothetical protein
MTPTNTPTKLTIAVTALRGARAHLNAARIEALAATAHLTGARASRAVEGAEKIVDALAHTERVLFVVTGDLRCEQ